MADPDLDWLGDIRWHGYPRLESLRDLGPDAGQEGDGPAPRHDEGGPAPDPRLTQLSRDNEALRARLEALTRLAAEFERRLSEASSSYEGAMLEAESRLRDADFQKQHLSGELAAAKEECARLTARDAAHEADLRLERERRSDAEKDLGEVRRRLQELEEEADRLRCAAAQQGGAAEELRRQAGEQSQRFLQAKALTDQDVQLLRQEMKDFLAKFHRIKESGGEKE